MKSKLLFVFTIITALVTSIGCKKKEGPAGAAGKDANVKAQTFSVTSWAYSSPSYYANYSDADITSTVQNSGTVDLFFSSNGGTTWRALPFTQYIGTSDYYWGYNTSVGNVQPTWTYSSSLSSGSDPNTVYGVTAMFKVVCVSAGARKANPDLDWSNYNEVKTRFHLAD
ncbi:MAG: hypothetical protein HY841_15240 [Bacteroidetes bacterium]|nr:hypothetical protein [Bacteroidota bacterium]